MIIRDRDGYEVRDYGEPTSLRTTLLSAQPSGEHIVGRSGINEKIWISTAQNCRLWDKARWLGSADDVARFMSRWGQITRWLGDEGDRPCEEPYILIEPHLKSLRYLASFVDADDRQGFCRSLNGQPLVTRANIVVDVDDRDFPLILEAPSLLRFMLLEMWSEFGGERPAHPGIRGCAYCGSTFHVGGRRGSKTRRGDARYCSDSCKNMASRQRKVGVYTQTAIPQP